MDIDLLGRVSSNHEVLIQVVRECISINVNDGMSFDADTIAIQDIVEDADYHGVRITFDAHLGTARVHMQIDIGFGDEVIPGPIWVDYPEILDFGTPRLRACTPETAIAEKLQVMVDLDVLNSRMKDFYDIYLMQKYFPFKGIVLAKAVGATFNNRGTDIPTEDVPLALSPGFSEIPEKQTQWTGFVRKLRTDSPPALIDVVGSLHNFLMPVLRAVSSHATFNDVWPRGGPWQSSRQGNMTKAVQ